MASGSSLARSPGSERSRNGRNRSPPVPAQASSVQVTFCCCNRPCTRCNTAAKRSGGTAMSSTIEIGPRPAARSHQQRLDQPAQAQHPLAFRPFHGGQRLRHQKARPGGRLSHLAQPWRRSTSDSAPSNSTVKTASADSSIQPRNEASASRASESERRSNRSHEEAPEPASRISPTNAAASSNPPKARSTTPKPAESGSCAARLEA